MEGLFINVDFSGHSQRPAKKGNRKHERFVRKRRFLRQCGSLKKHRKPEQPKSSSDQNGQEGGHDRTARLNNNASHQQGASQTVTVGAPCQPGTLSVNINCAANPLQPASAAKDHTSVTDGAKKAAKPFSQQHNPLSEYESCLPPVKPALSYKTVAIDCEMVGTGHRGRNSALARCSVVSYQGDVVYDKYVKPASPVTDYRTRWSGIRREHLTNAIPFSVAQKEILKLLHGKIVIGHAIQNDYKALAYFHPKEMTRDTSKIPLLNRKAGFPENETASLKRLAKQVLHKDIQMGKSGHSSVEDAKTTMELYRAVEAEYERELAAGTVKQ